MDNLTAIVTTNEGQRRRGTDDITIMWPLRGVSLQVSLSCRSLPSHCPAGRVRTRSRRMGNVMASSKTSSLPATLRDAPPEQLATFGAGCFWGTEKYFKDFGKAHGGLVDMRVGFMGDANAQKNPSYRDVCTGQSGHVEVLQLRFDPAKVSYASLVDHFFTFHDPTTLNRQGNDAGPQYASVIFAHTPEQAEVAKQRAAALQKLMDDGTIRPGFLGPRVNTAVRAAHEFYVAEDYHQVRSQRVHSHCRLLTVLLACCFPFQKYLEANPNGYCNHRKRFSWP